MATIKKAQLGTKQKPKPITGPTWVNLRMAKDKSGTEGPTTRQDSLDYKRGWERGLKGSKPSSMEKKYQPENEFEKMGRWEGQNKGKKTPVKKAKSGGKFPDLNKDGKITKADILKGRGVIAKKGASVKKAQSGIAVILKGKKTAKPNPAKKAMKAGGKMTKCKYGCK